MGIKKGGEGRQVCMEIFHMRVEVDTSGWFGRNHPAITVFVFYLLNQFKSDLVNVLQTYAVLTKIL